MNNTGGVFSDCLRDMQDPFALDRKFVSIVSTKSIQAYHNEFLTEKKASKCEVVYNYKNVLFDFLSII